MKQLKRILCVMLLLLPLTVAAVYLFKTLDARNGLNSSQINCIMKDSRGYVWFGTPAGLYRYDGYTFKYFQCNSQDGSSLPDSYIVSLQESLDGNLWVNTLSGLCVYHPQTETFERDMRQVFGKMGISSTPTVVYIDSHKNLWAAIPNKGVMAYNMQQQLLYEFGYTNDAQGVPEGNICSISECHDGAVIVYDDGRLVCCDIMHQQHTVWQTDAVASARLRKTPSLKAFADQMDNIWLYGQGTLMLYRKNANTWDMTFGDRLGMTGVAEDHAVNGMAGDRKGNIWIGTDLMGLLAMNVNTHEMVSVQPRGLNDRTYRNDETRNIQSLYVDDTDLLWVGTEKSGVAFSGQNIYKFESDLCGDVTALAQDATGKVWIGTSGLGVIGYDGPLASKKVSAMATTADGSLWVGSKRNGLTRIKDGTSTIYSAARDSMRTIINDRINALCTDKTGNLWIATAGGLQIFNPRMNTFSTYTRENGKLNTNNVTTLFYGKGNNLFVGTGEGLVVLNLSTTEKTVLTGNSTNLKTFTNNYITQVLEDSRGLLWIGTREGINVLNMENDSLNYITEKNGLANNCISGLTEDKDHNIWVTTTNGVTRVVVQRNHENGTFNYGLYNYDTSDGLQSNEFNKGAILTRRDGNVMMGGLNGVNWMRHHDKDGNETLPRVMLTQLFIGDTEVVTGHEYDGNVPLPQALNESNRIELTSDQNTFTIKFAAGNYNQSERLQFMFWMEGLDNDWHNGDALSHGVTFRNIGSGDYRLHVKAISADGAISNQERVLDITILRPWWISWWMIIIYAAVLAVAIYLWIFGFKRISYMWSKKKAIIRELAFQREEIKAASDDLRQPMARMTSIIGNMAEKAHTVENREQINSLHFQMLQIITRISEMQTTLENPESKASVTATNRMQLNDKGEIELSRTDVATLTADLKPHQGDPTTKQYTVIFIDDNEEFLRFIMAHLRNVYDMHVYNDVNKAAADLQVLKASIIVCKQNMPGTSGSELCNRIKMNQKTENIFFVLMTDGVLTSADMHDMNITLSADDYLAKPFNIQEAILRFNRLLGLAPEEMPDGLIEGKETRRLESINASMTTATINYDNIQDNVIGEEERTSHDSSEDTTDHAEDTATDTPAGHEPGDGDAPQSEYDLYYAGDVTMGGYTMNSIMDRKLMQNVEQYVLQNMSHGHISLEEMASAMGMGRVPFFRKIRSITSKTPAELVRELRLKHACTLLARTDINMSELAINLGFMTAENFAAIFKDKHGMSPLEYRLKHRKKH